MSAPVDARVAPGDPRTSRTNEPPGGERISQLPYLPGLDGIRAIAVVAVMVYHANSDWLAGGYLGVEVFFVISGYLITLLLIAEHERSGSIDLKSFWIRRFRRLLPALFVMMLLLTVWVALFEDDALGKLRGDVLAGALYGSNFYQVWIGAGYSAGSDFAPLRHLWSLAVEEQFYVIWPLVMIAFVRAGSRRIAGVARWLFLAAVVITVVVALLNHSGAQQSPELTPEAYWFIGDRPISKPDALYLSTFTRAGGLLLGAAFAMVWRPTAIMRGPLRTKGPLFDVLAVVGFVVLGWMSWTVSFQPDQGVHWLLFNGGLFLAGLASLAIIAAVTHRGAFTGRLLSMPVMLWIGTRSYGLYLYHWPIYQIVRNTAATKLAFHEFVLTMVATCIITELSYRYVETPIRQGKLREVFARRRRSSMTSGQRKSAMAAGVVAAGLSVFAVGSMATAELKQNELRQALDEGAEYTCDLLVDLDCDGTIDLDENGDPIDAADVDGGVVDDGAGFEVNDEQSGEQVVEGDPQEPAPDDPATNADDVPVPGQTTVPTTDPAPEPAARIAVGDSVMLGAAQQLNELGFTVSALESRSWINGLDFVQGLQAQDRLPDVMLIHLGTNGPIGSNDMERMMTAVADVPRVILITNDVEREYTAENNGLIYDAVNSNDNVEVLDWQGLASSCEGDCFESDGFHLKPDGRAYYARLIDFVLSNN